MVRAMCGAELMEKNRTEDLMEMLGSKETVVQMAKGEWSEMVPPGFLGILQLKFSTKWSVLKKCSPMLWLLYPICK